MPLWKDRRRLVLASTSVTRLQLLRSAALPVETFGASIDERAIEAELHALQFGPDKIALELAKAKGAYVSQIFLDDWVVAADQTLALGPTQFHKPASLEQAAQQLAAMAGLTHDLHSAVAVFRGGALCFEHVATARLKMRPLSQDFISDYLAEAGDIVTKSVGAYQVEGLGIHLFDEVQGDHSTILGLPLIPLLSFFRQSGLVES